MIEATWTLEELGARVKDALATGYVPPGSARVRAVPDPRTIRYYTTLGLIDRPALQGRTALYGERHLLQLVAIKRLQADGLSLTQVQERLAGLPEHELRALARVSATAPSPARAAAPSPQPTARRDFWRDVPEAAPEPTSDLAREPAADHPAGSARRLVGLELGPGVTLLLTERRTPDDDDVQALRAAAGPLLRALEDRGLLPGPNDEGVDDDDADAAR
ncbi:MAG: helix-turn-helix domain-containing protein [Planctomycetes bacterium]|nr:helix-turn-helix domain-containing protein [Planctomycetota bacterium]